MVPSFLFVFTVTRATLGQTIDAPRLVEQVPAIWPDGVVAQTEVRISVVLTIDSQGNVSEVLVEGDAGPELASAAREASLQWKFEPARRDGFPVAARVRAMVVLVPPPDEATKTIGPDAGASPATDTLQDASDASDPVHAHLELPAVPTPNENVRPVEVVVQGATSENQRLRESAQAVSVYDTTHARRQTADMGDVLNRAPGMNVVRYGGLGTDTRLTLNGLSDEQVRSFLDGLPLELAGFSFGIATVPVNLVERIEIYRGVVPIRFGADALGGAVNLVTRSNYYSTGATGSYQVGSFGTYRGAIGARYRDEKRGYFAAANLFLDSARNDYPIEVSAPDAQGTPRPAIVKRFNDKYSASGGYVDAGLLDRPYADKLLLRVFHSRYEKELQSNTLMTVPYGAVAYDESLTGATARYEKAYAADGKLDTEVVASASRRVTDFTDTSANVYDWYGRIIRVRPQGGEITGVPRDTAVTADALLGRVGLGYHHKPQHLVRLVSSPSYGESHGTTRVGLSTQQLDPLSSPRYLTKWVSGLEDTLNVGDDRVENIGFVKHYWMHAESQVVQTGIQLGPINVTQNLVGFGDGFRIRIVKSLWTKASYEYAARLPGAQELFGNGILISPNGGLRSERSHNGNLGLGFDAKTKKFGHWSGELNGFLRSSQNLIVLLGSSNAYHYDNVSNSRAIGIEGQLGWSSPKQYLSFEGSGTYQDLRNLSTSGPYGPYRGDRIPNTPYLFGSASIRGRVPELLNSNDATEIAFYTRFVHEFFRTWESFGARETKLTIASQLIHSFALTYVLHGPRTVSGTFEIDNFTDAKAYDVFGIQKPGRACFIKTTVDL